MRCKQPLSPDLPAPPEADEWVEYLASTPAWPAGVARLSERAVQWIGAVVGAGAKERALRAVEHACLDSLEDQGTIRQ